MITQGQRLTYYVQGNISLQLFGNATAASVRQAAAAALANPGGGRIGFDDVQITLTVGGLIDTLVKMEWITQPYEARVSVVTKQAYGTEGDVGSVIKGAFWSAAGNAPTVSSVQTAAIIRTSDTTTAATSGISKALSDALGGISSALGGAVDKANSVVQGNAIILIVGVLVLAYIVAGPGGRNVGAVARAARP